MNPVPAALLLAAIGTAALLADRALSTVAIAALLLVVCLRAPVERRWPYLFGAIAAAGSVFLFSPFLQRLGSDVVWSGPAVPVLGRLDVTVQELAIAAEQAARLGALALAFAAYALLVDHDRLVQAAGFARRSALAVALATRLVPTLERDARALLEALRGRGVVVEGVRGHARLVSPLLAGSLERGLNLAEAMEARGFGRSGATRVPSPPWTALDRLALAAGAALVLAGALWL